MIILSEDNEAMDAGDAVDVGREAGCDADSVVDDVVIVSVI
jgi:hypothetical protein